MSYRSSLGCCSFADRTEQPGLEGSSPGLQAQPCFQRGQCHGSAACSSGNVQDKYLGLECGGLLAQLGYVVLSWVTQIFERWNGEVATRQSWLSELKENVVLEVKIHSCWTQSFLVCDFKEKKIEHQQVKALSGIYLTKICSGRFRFCWVKALEVAQCVTASQLQVFCVVWAGVF